MAKGVWQRTIADDKGNVQPFASVTFTLESGGLASIYSDPAGTPSPGNPKTADANGFIQVYLDPDVAYRIDAVKGAYTATWRNEYVNAGIAGAVANGSETTTPADANIFGIIVDGVLNFVSWSNVKATLLTYFYGFFRTLFENYTSTLVSSSNNLVYTLLNHAGATPSATAPVRIAFLDTNIAGARGKTYVDYTSAQTMSLPAGGTLGANNGQTVNVYEYAIYDGTNKGTAFSRLFLDENALHTVSALDTDSDSATGIYGTVTGANYRVKLLNCAVVPRGTNVWNANPSKIYIPPVLDSLDLTPSNTSWVENASIFLTRQGNKGTITLSLRNAGSGGDEVVITIIPAGWRPLIGTTFIMFSIGTGGAANQYIRGELSAVGDVIVERSGSIDTEVFSGSATFKLA